MKWIASASFAGRFSPPPINPAMGQSLRNSATPHCAGTKLSPTILFSRRVTTSPLGSRADGYIAIFSLISTLFVRMAVGGRRVPVAVFAVFESGSCVLLGLFMLTEIVMMGRLMMMMCRGVVMSGRLMVVLTRWMLG
jgi:hypothetical protein